MDKIALIIIYNHKYDKNIDRLNELYKDRFSNIFHLVPFYTGDKPNVIAVYESSFYFQGYIAQGFKSFYNRSFSHYLFIGDDLILNPVINESSVTNIFKLEAETGFLPEMDDMPKGGWLHDRKALQYDPYPAGVEVKGEIPTAEEALKKIEAFGVKNAKYTWKDVYLFDKARGLQPKNVRYKEWVEDKLYKNKMGYSKYPFVRSYSDIFIVSGQTIKQFIHYCGVFAATNLWVELAIPTALALTSTDLRLQKDLTLQGKPLWTAEDYAELKPYDNSLQKLMDNFPANYIYLHPIKLSKWK